MTIYDQHNTHFGSVAAYVIVRDGERVATVAFARPKRASQIYAYVHWIGTRMVRGAAGGGGYDRHSAAAAAAAAGLEPGRFQDTPEAKRLFSAFAAALAKDDGTGWERALREAGFSVWQAV